MKKMNVEIPYYIQEEIEKYLWKKENGKGGSSTFENVLALIGLALITKRINTEQAEKIKEKLYELR